MTADHEEDNMRSTARLRLSLALVVASVALVASFAGPGVAGPLGADATIVAKSLTVGSGAMGDVHRVASAAAPPPTVADANAGTFLQYSAWARQNGVTSAACTGTGRAQRVDGVTRHASFRCGVEVAYRPAGSVVAKALGPEWLRVTSVSGDGLKTDPGIGAVPRGPLTLDSSAAGTALERSAWGRANDVESAFCSGVGPYRNTGPSYLFFAFSCAPLNTFASRGRQVLVVAAGKSSVRLVRTLSR